jgi:tetratricopeptide (TPR) repeat protein
LRPDYAQTYINRGDDYDIKGEYARALLDLDQAIKLKPDAPAERFNDRCFVEFEIGTNLGGALKDCDRALTLKPGEATSLDSRAWVHLKMGNAKPAMDDFDAALRQKPDQSSSLYGRGLLKRRQHDNKAGDADIAAALKLDPTLPETVRKWGITD